MPIREVLKMIAIPNMEKPKNCAECFRILKCKAVPRWITTDDGIPKGCPLIEIDDELISKFAEAYLKREAEDGNIHT